MMVRKKKKLGEWKPRRLKCNTCRQLYEERKPPITQVEPVDHICPKCEKRAWDAWEGKKPILNKEFNDEVQLWNKESGWGRRKEAGDE